MKQIIGNRIMGTIGSIFNLGIYTRIFVVTDEHVAKLHLDALRVGIPKQSEIFVLPAGEKEKNLASLEKILKSMHAAGCDRQTLVINLGGGVVSDIGGFAASIYMRGVDVLNIPTTLLSMTDAAIGGKNGINFHGVKNLIGTIRHPIGVVIDTALLTTLPKRQLSSGFAEIIKHGLIRDKSFFQLVTSKKPEKFTSNELGKIITRSCKIKAAIVASDEKEQDQRKLLNFGHTVGHAAEALSLETKKPMLHGEAISFGMIVETKISQLLGLLSQEDCDQVIGKLRGSPIHVHASKLLKKIQLDKKKHGNLVQWTLLDRIGHGVINQTVDDDIVKKSYENTRH